MKMQLEKTDTYGGEANYCWVKRETFEIPEELSNLAIVRRAKAWAGWNGWRCDVENYGDQLTIRPRGVCQVMFVSFEP